MKQQPGYFTLILGRSGGEDNLLATKITPHPQPCGCPTIFMQNQAFSLGAAAQCGRCMEILLTGRTDYRIACPYHLPRVTFAAEEYLVSVAGSNDNPLRG
jgi:hypothetical protein